MTDPTTTSNNETVASVTKGILPAFDHIKDPEYRAVIAGCWARAAIRAMREPTEAMLIAAREWSREKYGRPIGADAATGCWRAMWEAANAPG